MSQDTASPTGAEGPVTATGASREDAAAAVSLRIATVAKLNLADFQNAIPAVQELAIVNATRADLQQLTLTLSSEPAFVKPRSWTLERVGAGETYHLSDLDVQLDGALLSRLTEAEPATLRFELRSAPAGPQGAGTAGDEAAADTDPDAPLATQDRVVELLARHQWGGIGQLPEMVAAFVQPNDPAVDRLLKAAAQALEAGGKSGDIDGYKQGAKRAWELASGLWTAVLQQRLNYALPPASFEHTGQKVRGPSQIIDAGLATCLDLTLLFAACLEQANLHPLLVFTRGHAFVGLWLRPEEFSTAVVDDITAVRKRLKLQEMLVFETTLAAQGPNVGFSQAIAHANRQLSEEQEDQFELVVDVKRARMSRIRPLALAQATPEPAPPADTPVLPLAVEDAPELPEDRAPEATSSELDPKDRLARWQRKLLDLSLRNALLNFKPGKKSLLLEAAAPALEDALAEGQTLKLLPSPDLMQGRDPRNQQLHEARSLEDLRRAHAAEALQRREVFIRLEEKELEGRLVELFRGARNTLQEGGANTLFLALGFLVWTRPDRPDVRVRAPLILLPVTLDRKSARSGFSLRPHEDEARFNPTLVEMLRQDFQLELGVPMGDLPQGRSAEHGDGGEGVEIGLDVQGLWSRVRTAIKDIRGWEVSEDVVLSMFSFAKYLMWKDLVERTDELRQSPVVAHLIDTPREPYRSSVAFPDARRLDTEFKPQQVFCPLPADSSQISAVMAAAAGKDFVLIGPPGTGKSQTIANLIAQCLAEDKRVLFVAEKVAALDVVYRRLREVGLGEFCLELHSSKARKLDVLAQLKQSWESKGEVDEAGWQAKADQLGRVRQQLSTYVDRLHLRRANGLTVYGAIGRVVTGEGTPELRLGWPDVAAHDEATLADLREQVGRLQVNAGAVGTQNLADGPLALIHRSDWSVRWQQDLVAAARSLRESTEAVIGSARLMCEQMDIDLPALDGAGRASLGQLAQALLQAAGQPWAFCALPNAADICADLKAGAELLARHRALSAQMSPTWPAELQAQLLDALELLGQRRRLQAELGAPVPATAVDDLARGVRAIEQMNRLRADLSVTYGAGVAQLNVAALQREWAKAEQAVWPVSWLGQRKVRAALEAVIEGAGEPNIAEDLNALVRIRALRTEVEQIQPHPAMDGLWAGLRTRLDAAQAVLRANAALQSARAERPFSLDGLALAAEGQCGERWVAEVGRLQRLHALDRRLADCMPLNGGSDGLWRGHDTDVDLLRAALAFEQACEPLRTQGALSAPHALIAEGRAGLRLQQAHTHLVARATLETRLAGLGALAAQCPGLWAGLDTDLEAVERALQFRSAVQASLSLQPENPEALRQGLHWVLSQRAHELSEGAAIGRSCQLLRGRLPLMDAALAAFGGQAAQPEAERLAFAAWPASEIVAVAARLDATHTDLRAWCAWRSACAAATSGGLGALVAAVASGEIDPATAPQAFEVNYARAWLAATVDEDEVLKRFVPAEHERRIHEFRALDDEFTAVTRQWIRARLCAGLPAIDSLPRSGAGSTSEWGVLRREITKKRQHLPLRQLLQEIPSAVLRLAPCLLMSPLSIAQYLSAGTSSFDIVIFDEASQIPVWDAIGAMARAKQVVMVGDPKQLPPTNFFDRAESADGDSQDVEADMESILDECLGASLPTRNLSWHYRSRHESLIAFSNHRYYGGALVTFPSPLTEDRAVSFHPVQGRYEKGGARINQPEAKALVADIVARLRSPGFRESGLTVGVVTFNTEQQRLVEDLLDEERRLDPGLEPFFSEMELEPLFVKNLESVQGDERDIMYFSIAYGPDLAGAVSMNLGPLNRDGGERRLNVAVTRARHELRVFSSLRGDQLDLSRTQAAGVRDLKHFLEFAERGSRALAEAHQGSRGDFDSPFEAGVAQALARKGWQVHTQIGASSFRVDLGVVHPDFAGRYLAGVECDGATYHRSATARDRDKLREQVLRGLGWDILRIWSTDWWVNPGGTLERVHERLTALLEKDRERRAAAMQAADERVASAAVAEGTQVAGPNDDAPGLPGDEAAPDAQAVDEARQAIARAAGRDEAGEAARPAGAGSTGSTSNGPPQTYARAATLETALPASAVESLPGGASPAAGLFRVSNPADAVPASAISADDFYEFSYDPLLKQMVEWIVKHEGPVLDTVLARRIARTHGFQRTGSRIQQRVEQIARQHFGQTEEAGGTFYWPQGTPSGAALAFRHPADDDSVRGVQEICEQELLSLAQGILRSGRTGDAAIVTMARELGMASLRTATRSRLEQILAAAATR